MPKTRTQIRALLDANDVVGLIEALFDEDPDTRGAVAFALGELGRVDTADPLTLLLEDDHPRVRLQAARSLDKLAWRPAGVKERAAYMTAKQSWRECVRLRDAATPYLIRALSAEYYEIREKAAEALGEIQDERAVDPLLSMIQDPNKDVRLAVVKSLTRITKQPEQLVEPFIYLLLDKWWYVRAAAAKTLLDLYVAGDLNERLRERIREQKRIITQPHYHETFQGKIVGEDGFKRPGTITDDFGIGLDWPEEQE